MAVDLPADAETRRADARAAMRAQHPRAPACGGKDHSHAHLVPSLLYSSRPAGFAGDEPLLLLLQQQQQQLTRVGSYRVRTQAAIIKEQKGLSALHTALELFIYAAGGMQQQQHAWRCAQPSQYSRAPHSQCFLPHPSQRSGHASHSSQHASQYHGFTSPGTCASVSASPASDATTCQHASQRRLLSCDVWCAQKRSPRRSGSACSCVLELVRQHLSPARTHLSHRLRWCV